MSMSQWLQRVGLARIEGVLAAHDIAEDVLSSLTESDLEKLGLSMGERKRLLRAIAEQPPQPAAHAQSGELRQLTIMFCDLVDSTALCQHLSAEQWREVVLAYQQTAARVIDRCGGEIAQYLGDGILVYFGYPQAHEDAAERAVRAALELVAAVPEIHLPWSARIPDRLAVRIGVHTGLVVIGDIGAGARREQLALGEAPTIAARLQALAAPNTVLISDSTRALAGAGFHAEDLGRHELKGVLDARQVWRVAGIVPTSSRFDAVLRGGLTPLVGRGQELGLLMDRWALARQGQGQVVMVSGEAGIGKSRMLKELRDRLGNEGLQAVQLQCSAHHVHSAFHPSIDYLERVLRLTRELSPEVKLDRLESLVVTQLGHGASHAALLASMLSLPGEARYGPLIGNAQQREQQTVEVLADLIAARARRSPTLVLLEDVHWADPATVALLRWLVTAVRGWPVLLVVTHRPEFRLAAPPADHLAELQVHSLRRAEVSALVARLAADSPLPPDLTEHIVNRTDGVPLFVEELTRAMVEGRQGGAARQTVPATLRDSLMARLDRFGAAKELAQMGAVVGRDFSHELIEALSDWPPSRLAEALGELTRSGLVLQHASHRGTVYSFKHALVQDAAYSSLLTARRQQLHGAIVKVLESRFAAQARDEPETVARHASAAGLAHRAIPYWRQASDAALQRLALHEAVAHLNAALGDAAALPASPERQQTKVQLQASLGTVHMLGKGWGAPEVVQAFARANELASAADKVDDAIWPLWGVCVFHMVRGEIRQAQAIGQRMITLARQANSRHAWLVTNMMHTQLCLYSGSPAEVAAHCLQLEHRYNDPQDRALIALYSTDLKLVSMVHGSQARLILGLDDDASAQLACDEQERFAAALNHPYSLAWTLTWGAMSYLLREQVDELLVRAAEGLRLARQHGFAYVAGIGTFVQGWGWARQGNEREGIAAMQEGLTAFEATGARIAVPFFQALLAEALGAVGRNQEALALLDRAQALTELGGEHWHEAELWRIRAGIVAASPGGDRVEARAAAERAVALAAAQRAGLWRRRAAVTLAQITQAAEQRPA